MQPPVVALQAFGATVGTYVAGRDVAAYARLPCEVHPLTVVVRRNATDDEWIFFSHRIISVPSEGSLPI